ncbi:uncharacterized protein LTR77_004430 [Saxophila tyrrhenica]|uniref:Glutaminase n=1 Tax=Saxophila tyrrhenica TaxID=1690608 RepID=A0AAV9PD37_9PEZI|nr:hypothetical protein LTR77_004430 [Saxophila tyrrhenica]
MALLRRLFSTILCLYFFSLQVQCQPSFAPILPPSYPLAVKNPYLSAWLPGNQTADLPSAVPQFWTGQELTWSVIARVDGQAYSLFGVPEPVSGIKSASFKSAEYTSTHTTFTLEAGAAIFTLDFFSPVSLNDYVRQSMPFSYLIVSASGLDGAAPSLQVYSDMDNSWTGQFGENVQTNWNYALSSASTQVFTLTSGGTAMFSEVEDMAQWGTAVYCTKPSTSTISPSLGDMATVRSSFANNGSLPGDWDWKPGSVIALSHDLGAVSTHHNVTFAVGYVRQVDVNYMSTPRAGYWKSAASDINMACVRALLDFKAADAEGRALDAGIASRATAAGGGNYSDVVSLSVRQVFGAFDVTVPEEDLSKTEDVMAFVKEISSNGNVNTIDVIMPISPTLFVIAPEYIRLLLEPVMQYLDTGAWPHQYTIHDLGTHYPNATGHNDGVAEEMPVEECGNIIVLAYMYQLASGNIEWASNYASLFRQYADYLVLNGLYPTLQLSSDDGAGPVANRTGLAIKAAIALNAYGVMTGQSNYSDTGRQFADELYEQTAGTDADRTHFTLTQRDDNSWGIGYNLFLDVLLKLDTFPTEAYAMQTNYYQHVRAEAGLALDSRVDWGKTDWMNFAAATAMAEGVGNEGVRDMLVGDVHAFLASGQNTAPFSDNFFGETNGSDVAGIYNIYRARPVVGGHFALMALGGPNQNQLQASDGGYEKRSEGGGS